MKKILILADKEDAHARIVSRALEMKGAQGIRWDPGEFLLKQKINLFLKPVSSIEIYTKEGSINLNEIDVVWFRRPRLPTLPNSIHPDDEKFIKEESISFMRALWSFMCESAVWINPFSSYHMANSKLVHLRLALELGFIIPNTLVSNDKNRILDFLAKNKCTGVIYKTFMPFSWQEEEGVFSSQTAIVSADFLPEQEVLQMTPGIYQSLVLKAYEIRATFFNDCCIAVRIENHSEIDWRSLHFKGKIPIGEIKLPNLIYDKCIQLMKKLGISFGCFDFIVTPAGEYIFLEVNEMGQFLWIEELLPELKLLNTFCDFVLTMGNRGSNCQYEPSLKLSNILDR
ncbi:hypothetical protein CC99x_006930 [Candidatus Berkiella cookevillensis]|uniref:MvdD-like pre-ATP grasp domain-containing protein n=1 Tax=Candidatus Berkiella cookevillensis TaxID=437022 RepID=A0A0Q9YC86_9GAMM|nr:hypothetical protein [Candidatus Berkiella cookevillensis]MCS5708640.1 hypothetical protein [Candidatus Berkiella cookevillensis]